MVGAVLCQAATYVAGWWVAPTRVRSHRRLFATTRAGPGRSLEGSRAFVACFMFLHTIRAGPGRSLEGSRAFVCLLHVVCAGPRPSVSLSAVVVQLPVAHGVPGYYHRFHYNLVAYHSFMLLVAVCWAGVVLEAPLLLFPCLVWGLRCRTTSSASFVIACCGLGRAVLEAPALLYSCYRGAAVPPHACTGSSLSHHIFGLVFFYYLVCAGPGCLRGSRAFVFMLLCAGPVVLEAPALLYPCCGAAAPHAGPRCLRCRSAVATLVAVEG